MAVQTVAFTVKDSGGNAREYVLPFRNVSAAAAPTVNDDSGDGYIPGSQWTDTTNGHTYECVDNTLGAAVWVQTDGAGGAYTDEQAQDAVGTILTDTATIDLTYNDGANTITADVKANSVGVSLMHASATDVLFGRSTAGAGAGEEIACTAAGRALIDDANAAAQLVTLGAAPLASPTFTGTPAAPTAAGGTNTTQIATTAFVTAAVAAATPAAPLTLTIADAGTTTVVKPLVVSHTTSGTAAAGFGVGIDFQAESGGGTNRIAASIAADYTTATNGAETAELKIYVITAGTAATLVATFDSGSLLLSGGLTTTGGIDFKNSTGNDGILAHANSTSRTWTFPNASGNVVIDTATQTLTNKTIGVSQLTTFTGFTGADPAMDDEVPGYDLSATANKKFQADRLLALARMAPGGRLTLSTGVPVTSSDVTGATNVFYAPYAHDMVCLWDGTRWVWSAFAEKTLALGTLTSGKNYDAFGFLSSGALALEALVWTNDTTRATAVTIQDGRYCKSGDKTRLYLGTFRATATTTTEDSNAKRFLFNQYNRDSRRLYVQEATGSWAYTSAAWRAYNNSATNRIQFVVGDPGGTVVNAGLNAAASLTSGTVILGIALDNATTPSAGAGDFISPSANVNTSPINPYGPYRVAAGFHFLQACEFGATGATIFGTNVATSAVYGDIFA